MASLPVLVRESYQYHPPPYVLPRVLVQWHLARGSVCPAHLSRCRSKFKKKQYIEYLYTGINLRKKKKKIAFFLKIIHDSPFPPVEWPNETFSIHLLSSKLLFGWTAHLQSVVFHLQRRYGENNNLSQTPQLEIFEASKSFYRIFVPKLNTKRSGARTACFHWCSHADFHPKSGCRVLCT